jgi:ketosteroid isomerase-like protein
MIKRTLFTLTLVGVAGNYATLVSANPSDSSKAIRAAYNEWVEAVNAKDIEWWSRFLAPGALFLPPDIPALDSNDAIINFYVELFRDQNFTLDCVQSFVEISDSNDLAWTRGTCRATFSLPNGEVGRGSSKWAKVWVRSESGEWKCRLNAWNNDE